MVKSKDELNSSFLSKHLKHQKTLDVFVLEKKECQKNFVNHYIIKDQNFIELSRVLCVKEVILSVILAMEVNQFMGSILKMKAFSFSMTNLVYSRWQIKEK